nr:twin-arginine translocation signal domain-containing protein [Planctomycetota bacterium]
MSKFSSLSRRTFLRGAGAVIALPALEKMALSPSFAAANETASASPVRMAWVFFPNGTIPD